MRPTTISLMNVLNWAYASALLVNQRYIRKALAHLLKAFTQCYALQRTYALDGIVVSVMDDIAARKLCLH
jgi:hypothetical protein